MKPLRVLIADDEAVARRRLRRLLNEQEGFEIAGECADGAEVLAALAREGADILLLDIRMPRLSGLEVLELIAAPLGQPRPAIILTTAYMEHAAAAFDLEAVDYVLKPVEEDRLARALGRARRWLAQEPPVAGAGAGPKPVAEETRPAAVASSADVFEGATMTVAVPDRLPIPTRKGVVLLDPTRVTHALIEGNTCSIHTPEEVYITDFRLSDLERRLPPGHFARVHRRALVNLEQILRLEPQDTGGYLAHLRGGATVEISRQCSRELRRRWELPR